jgi:hypothetical protein
VAVVGAAAVAGAAVEAVGAAVEAVGAAAGAAVLLVWVEGAGADAVVA